MENKLKNLIDLVKSLPESRLDVAIEKLTEIKRESEKEKSGYLLDYGFGHSKRSSSVVGGVFTAFSSKR